MGMSASQGSSQEGCWAERCVQACCTDGLYRQLKAQTHTGSTPSGHTPFCVISTIQDSQTMQRNTGSVHSQHDIRDNSPPPRGCFPHAEGDKMKVFVLRQKLCTCK